MYIGLRSANESVFQQISHLIERIFLQLIALVENNPFEFGKVEVA